MTFAQNKAFAKVKVVLAKRYDSCPELDIRVATTKWLSLPNATPVLTPQDLAECTFKVGLAIVVTAVLDLTGISIEMKISRLFKITQKKARHKFQFKCMNMFLSVSHHYKYLSARARGSVGDRSLPGSRLSCSSPLQKPRPRAGDQGAALHGSGGCWSKGTECCLSKGGWNKGGWGKGTKCCLIWFCSFESKPWADQRTSLFQGLPTCNMKDFFLQGSKIPGAQSMFLFPIRSDSGLLWLLLHALQMERCVMLETSKS